MDSIQIPNVRKVSRAAHSIACLFSDSEDAASYLNQLQGVVDAHHNNLSGRARDGYSQLSESAAGYGLPGLMTLTDKCLSDAKVDLRKLRTPTA